jgi:hypothetical protein
MGITKQAVPGGSSGKVGTDGHDARLSSFRDPISTPIWFMNIIEVEKPGRIRAIKVQDKP